MRPWRKLGEEFPEDLEDLPRLLGVEAICDALIDAVTTLSNAANQALFPWLFEGVFFNRVLALFPVTFFLLAIKQRHLCPE